MRVVNLFAGPGAGKSTTAAGLFHLMKLDGMSVELVTEYAKEMTWEKRHNILTDQLYILAKQHRRVSRLRDEVDYVVTDSPFLVGILYRNDDYSETLDRLVVELWNRYENVNFFLERVKAYVPVGRNQTEDEARRIDVTTKELLARLQVPYEIVVGDAQAASRIFARIKQQDTREEV